MNPLKRIAALTSIRAKVLLRLADFVVTEMGKTLR